MLAGRKLLLADDSITIQKVVSLTFADEGVEVVSVGNGRDAIDRLPEFLPDVVLADVFMPQMSGYEVCEHIKQNEKLKHIPVMLLVGSFEPFDEAEARRVGADDTLTKPFQSIRNLIDKVGALVAGRPPEEQIPTAELPHAEEEPEPERLTEEEIAVVTADTQPLPAELRHMVEESAAQSAREEAAEFETQTKTDQMENRAEVSGRGDIAGIASIATGANANDALLDLGGFEPGSSKEADDFVLDIDLDEVPDASSYQPSAYVRPPASRLGGLNTYGVGSKTDVATSDQLARTQEFPQGLMSSSSDVGGESERKTSSATSRSLENKIEAEAKLAGPVSHSVAQTSPEGLSPEIIDAIARRAVEQLSEKVVREIAWEVVPDLAELLIKRQLEEK